MSIKRIEIDKETIYLKKSPFFKWGVVYPLKNEDGSINWFNLLTGGTWARLISVVIIVFLILLVVYQYSSDLNTLIGCFGNMTNLQVCIDSFNPNLTLSYLP